MDISCFLIVGGSIAAQTPKIQTPFKQVLPGFDQIVEIGFHRGAFSLWLSQNKNPSAKLVCYDISFAAKEINNPNIDFRQGDCFDQYIVNEIDSLIRSPLRTLVLCDGGDKESEFSLYSRFLKKADVIMCHDYAHSDEDYRQRVAALKWPTPSESHFSNISKAVLENGLSGYHYNEFKDVLWGSFVKV